MNGCYKNNPYVDYAKPTKSRKAHRIIKFRSILIYGVNRLLISFFELNLADSIK